MKELNVSNPLVDKPILTPSDINIKISEVRWCSRQYLQFTITFSLFYLFGCKFADLMIFTIFSFLEDKICAPEKLGASRRFLRGRAICPGLLLH